MQKIYVLLRNDQQTGPYTLEEITKFDLKPYDLIWIEGKSAGWYYPQEIGALRPHLNFLPKTPATQNTTAPKAVFVAMPAVPTKEETPPLPSPAVETPIEPIRSFAPVSENLERDVYAQFAAKKEEEKLSSATTVASVKPANQYRKNRRSVGVGIATVLVVGGVFAASWIMNRQPKEEEVATPDLTASAPVEEVTTTAPAASNNASLQNTNFSSAKQKPGRTSSMVRQTAAPVIQSTTQSRQESVSKSRPQAEQTVEDDAATTPVKEEPAVAKEDPTSSPEETATPQEKKKKLRDKIFDIFRKKPDEQGTDEAKPSETTSSERQSTHRENGANLAQMVSIRFTVPNDWMIGVKGAKATLFNRSNQRIEKATIEVLYYNDENELLQKKIITFSRIDGKEAQTISIPDHSSATRVDYNVISVNGQPAA